MVEQVLERFYSMKLEQSRQNTRLRKIFNEVIEAKMIFAIRQQNIYIISKMIPLLGRMQVIVTLLLKKTLQQCSQGSKQTHKKKNYAKHSYCFYYSNDKYDVSNYNCIEQKCKNSLKICPHPPKCIVCNRSYTADFEYCLPKLGYLKLK